MGLWANFWDIIGLFLYAAVFIAYLIALFSVIGDLFRDHKLSGWWKAIWVLFLIFVPFLTVLVYLIARGGGMADRSARVQQAAQASTDAYIREAAGRSTPTDEIGAARVLLDQGTITQAEFEQLKSRALQR